MSGRAVAALWRTPTSRTSPSSATCITRRHASSRAGPSWSTTACGSRPCSSRSRRVRQREPAPRDRRGAAALRGTRDAASWRAVVARSPSTTTGSPPTTHRTHSATRTPRGSCACGAWAWPRGRPGRDPGVDGRREGRAVTLWEGRLAAGMADAVAEFTVSLPFDRVLAATTWPDREPTCGAWARPGS